VDSDAEQSLVERIDALLPQTQCSRCGYPGCQPYAAAIARGAAEINCCPPGGEQTIVALAALLGTPLLPLDRSRGETSSLVVACIDESACIGCTLCIAACPVDAIIGAAKLMHTVLADRCTGCELCVPPCPVDCIALLPTGRAWTRGDAAIARQRFAEHGARRGSRAAQPGVPPATPDEGETRARRRAEIGAALDRALERARARRAVSARSRSRS
jgi:Na+-translocating ferredoxin:NAD+ oxidoreductase subunit B